VRTDLWPEVAGYGRRVCATLDREDVERITVTSLPELVGADAAGLYLLDARYRPQQITRMGASDDLVYDLEALGRRSDPFFQLVLRTRRPVDDSTLYGRSTWRRHCVRGQIMAGHGFAHSMIVPLLDGPRLVGTVNLARAHGRPPFGPADSRIALELAAFSAIALRNARRSAATTPTQAHPGIVRHVPTAAQTPCGDQSVLTAREREVLRLVAAGLRNHEIAGELTVTVHTVKQHLKHVYAKLGVRSRVEAARLFSD
jgi:DNA-binding CsgD family transcriptional regulator